MSTTAVTLDSLLARLRSAAGTLVPAERRVAEVLMRQLHRLEEYSAVALAAEASCSAATVVRACQRMGFTGFQQLRLQSIRLAAGGTAELPAELPQPASRGQYPEHDLLLNQVFTAAIDDIRASAATLDRPVFDRAVAKLAAANTVLLAGTGSSAVPVQDAALRLTMSGHTVVAPHDVLGQQIAARLLDAGDVCIAVSHSGANRHTLRTVQAARQAGATIVAVTSTGLSSLARSSDLVLVTGSADADTEVLAGRLSQLLVLNALNLAAQRARGRTGVGPAHELAELLAEALEEPYS